MKRKTPFLREKVREGVLHACRFIDAKVAEEVLDSPDQIMAGAPKMKQTDAYREADIQDGVDRAFEGTQAYYDTSAMADPGMLGNIVGQWDRNGGGIDFKSQVQPFTGDS